MRSLIYVSSYFEIHPNYGLTQPVQLFSIGTSMACPHVCGLVAALLTKKDDGSVSYSDLIRNDAGLRRVLKKRCRIDIGARGPDNATGLGFLTYLTKEEFNELW